MKIITSNLVITKDNYKECENIEKVKGDLSIYSDIELNELKSVGGYLYISSKARVTLKKLNHIEGDLYINPSAKLNLSPEVEAYFIAKKI